MVTELVEKGILIKKLNKSPVDRAFGIWKTKDSGMKFVDKIRKDRRR